MPESEQEKRYVAESYHDLHNYIPIVLTINDRLKYVKIISSGGDELAFRLSKKELIPNDKGIVLYKTSILKGREPMVMYSIEDKENEIEIILPINSNTELYELPDRVARLFLYYPLIGTEKFGINFIINCKKFLPTEQRDGIHLRSNKDQVADQEKSNRELMHKASELLFQFLESNVLPVKNPLLYAKIDFRRDSHDKLLDEYFRELQQNWVNRFKMLPIVETRNGNKEVGQVNFISASLLLEKEEYFDCIYYLGEKFYAVIPSKHVAREWSPFVDRWDYADAVFINNEDLAKQVENAVFQTLTSIS